MTAEVTTEPSRHDAATTRGDRRLDVQGLRAIAVLMVVAFHAGLPMPGGFVGVDVFFVISGYVITTMLHREWQRTGRISFRNFYLRRFKRLTPALALMVAGTMLMSAMLVSPLGQQQTAAETAVGAMLLAANVVIASTTGGYFDAPAESNPLLNTWSLSVEEQFYLVFPALLALAWAFARPSRIRRWMPLLVIGSVALISFAMAASGSSDPVLGSSFWFGFYSPLTRAWEFAAGALLALIAWKLRSHRAAAVTGFAGLLLVGTSMLLISGRTPFPGAWTLMPVFGAVLLLLAGTNPVNPVSRMLALRPMVKVGDWSYSIYLWHWPFIVFAGIAWPTSRTAPIGASALALIPAVASYRWVEQPIRSLGATSRRGVVLLVVSVVLPPLLLAGVVGRLADAYWRPLYQDGGSRAYVGDIGHDEFHSFVERSFYPCTPNEIRQHALRWEGFLRCQQSKPAGPIQVAIIGDSHAEHLFLGLAEAAPGTNIAYYITAGLPTVGSSEDMARILNYVSTSQTIRVVVISAYWQSRGAPVAELSATFRDLRSHGKEVFDLS